MLRICLFFLLLVLAGCTPTTPPQQLPKDCSATAPVEQLLGSSWLTQGDVWRLRQLTLLEIGPKKIPLEGFLRLDTANKQARLVAMNEMGVVLFDLLVTEDGQQLERAIPQLQQVKGLAAEVAQSLRQIFLQPRPAKSDRLENLGSIQKLWRSLPGGYLRFIYDCRSDLRTVRFSGDSGDWRVVYNDYQAFAERRLPVEIVMNDYRHGVKLSLWIREVKGEK
jgi:outer membrane biogenesis lipoprotein LolB